MLWKHCLDLEFQDTLPLTLLLIVEYLQQLRNPKIDLGQNPEVFYESHLDWMMVQCRFYIQTIGVDVHCWDLKIHAFFTVTRAGKGWGAAYLECLSVWQGKGAAVPMGCPQPPALSQPGSHAHVTKKVTPTSEYALTPATMKSLWKCWTDYFSILWGEIWGFIYFF